jgi:hypothetical protein
MSMAEPITNCWLQMRRSCFKMLRFRRTYGIMARNILVVTALDLEACAGWLAKTHLLKRKKEKGVLKRLTYRYPFDHQSQATLVPDSTLMGN